MQALPRKRKNLSRPQAFSRLFKDTKQLRARFEEEYPQFKAPDDEDGSASDDGVQLNIDGGADGQLTKEDRKKAMASHRTQKSLPYWNQFIAKLYAEATNEEKQLVEDFRNEFKQRIDDQAANVKAELEKEPDERSPEELHR